MLFAEGKKAMAILSSKSLLEKIHAFQAQVTGFSHTLTMVPSFFIQCTKKQEPFMQVLVGAS